MDVSIGTIEVLLLIAAIVAMLESRFRVPYSVGLVLAGLVLSLLPGLPKVRSSKELIFTILLPPLIFEAALYIRWRELRKDIGVILMLASVGVLLSACITTLGLHYIVNWEWASAMLFGVLIAATDPVSVIATLRTVLATSTGVMALPRTNANTTVNPAAAVPSLKRLSASIRSRKRPRAFASLNSRWRNCVWRGGRRFSSFAGRTN